MRTSGLIYPHFFSLKHAEMRYNYQYKFMKDNLILQDKNYISAKRAADIFGYASDYVGQLCRAGKLDSQMVGKSWFVTQESIIKHRDHVASEFTLKATSKKSPKGGLQQPTPTTSFVPAVLALVPYIPVVNVVVKSLVLPKVIFLESATVPTTSYSPILASVALPITFVPDTFALPNYISNIFLTSPDYSRSSVSLLGSDGSSRKLVFAAGLCVIATIFMFQSVSTINPSSTGSQHSVTASVVSSSGSIFRKTISFFTAIPKLAVNIFKEDSNFKTVDSIPTQNINSNNSGTYFNGLAITPSTNSGINDEIIKNKIRKSFSDEVVVSPDATGTSGVITPVFKVAKGDDFIYVLVPVQNTN